MKIQLKLLPPRKPIWFTRDEKGIRMHLLAPKKITISLDKGK